MRVECDLFLDADRLPELFAGTRRRRAPRCQCRRTVRVGRAPARPRAERHRHPQRARGGATRRGATPACSPPPARCTANAQSCPRPRTRRFPVQTSLYGASKAAAEGYIAAVRGGRPALGATVFRFVSVLGPRYSHGHVIDFVRQLSRDRESPAHPRRRHAAQELHARAATAWPRCVGRARRTTPVRGVQPRRRRLLHGHRVGRVDLRSDWASNPVRVHRRGPRLDRRQSVHLSRHPERSVPPAGRPASPSARRSRAPSTTCWPTPWLLDATA